MAATVDQRVMEFLAPVQEYVLLNAGDEWIEIGFDGETRKIPPITEVVLPHPMYPDVPHSAKDADGNFIPGTLVLSDIVDARPEGDLHGVHGTSWSAAAAIKHCLQIDVRTGMTSGAFSEKGLSVLPVNPSPELVATAVKEGRARYKKWMITVSERIVLEQDSRNEARKRAGLPEIGGDSQYLRAAMLLKAHRDQIQKEVEAIVESAPVPKEEEIDALLRAKVAVIVTKKKEEDPTIDAEEVTRQLLQDPEILEAARKGTKGKRTSR